MRTDPVNDALDGVLSGELRRVREAYARRESHSWYSFSNPAYLLAIQEREQTLLAMLAARGYSSLENAKVLEVGCGTGSWLRDFVRWGARPENICGVDLLPGRIEQARELCPAGITLKCQDATKLEMGDGSFDLVLQSTVFTSILNSNVREMLAREMVRVLRARGIVVWYDFRVNNPRNPDVRGVGKSEVKRLFPDCNIFLQSLTLAPPLGRPIAPLSPALYRLLSRVKPLCTHYLGIISKP